MARRFVVDSEGGCEEVKIRNPTIKQHKIKAAGRDAKLVAQAAGIIWLNANQGTTRVEVVVEDA